ncbi:Fe-Mn family superoxide dismutase [Ilyonectria robusta]
MTMLPLTFLLPIFAIASASEVPLIPSICPLEATLPITMSVGAYALPALPYAYDTYATAIASNDIAGQIALQSAIKFNGGGHINHSLFWENLTPASSADANPESAPTLMAEVAKTWGGLESFQAAMTKTLLGLQGSGWGWLVKDSQGLRIVTTKDQDPVVGGEVPIFGIDMWEHAYYLQVSTGRDRSFRLTPHRGTLLTDKSQYLNGKAAYIDNIWKVINWKTCEARFIGTREDAFKILRASI